MALSLPFGYAFYDFMIPDCTHFSRAAPATIHRSFMWLFLCLYRCLYLFTSFLILLIIIIFSSYNFRFGLGIDGGSVVHLFLYLVGVCVGWWNMRAETRDVWSYEGRNERCLVLRGLDKGVPRLIQHPRSFLSRILLFFQLIIFSNS